MLFLPDFADFKSHVTSKESLRFGEQELTIFYTYFPNIDDGIQVPLSDWKKEFYVAILNPQQYGFGKEKTVALSRNIPSLPNLPEYLQEDLEKLLCKGEAPLHEVLETVAGCMRGAMAYDFEAFDCLYSDAGLRERVRNSGYRATGKETLLGICADSGILIRSVLAEMVQDDTLRMAQVISATGGTQHDTTAVFSLDGSWAVVNSLSPTKHFNVATRKQLEIFGTPYATQDF